MNGVKVGFFSVSDRGESDDDPDDRAHLGWHQLDHMPEQYQLPGMIHGQRWVSNDACRAARAVASGVAGVWVFATAVDGRGVGRRPGHAVAGGSVRRSGSMGLAGWRLSVI